MKINMFTLLAAVVMQFVVGYLWYGTHLFGGVVSIGDHGIDFLKLDVLSLLLIILTSYGLTYIVDMFVKLNHVKDIGGVVKLGLTVGSFAIGLPIVMLLNFMGIGHVALLVVFTHLVIVTILTGIIDIKLKA